MKLRENLFPKKSRLAVVLLLIVSMLSLNYVSVIAQNSSFVVPTITIGTGVSTIINLPSVVTTVATSVGTSMIAPHTAGTTVATSVSSTLGTTVGTTVSTTVGRTTATTVATTTATTWNTITPAWAPGDFSIDLSSLSLTVAQGSVGNVQVSVASYNSASPVSLTFTGTSGITGLFSSNPVTSSSGGYSNFGTQWSTTAASSVLSISVPTSVALGVYLVTVTGSSASFYHSMTLTVNVMPASTMVSSMSSPQYSVNIANKPGIGSYLTNATGWTLYTFA